MEAFQVGHPVAFVRRPPHQIGREHDLQQLFLEFGPLRVQVDEVRGRGLQDIQLLRIVTDEGPVIISYWDDQLGGLPQTERRIGQLGSTITRHNITSQMIRLRMEEHTGPG